MPRIARQLVHVPGAVVHVIVRFVDGRFVLDDAARAHYLRLLARALRCSDWRLFCYALMSSHVHLGCLSGTAELHRFALPLHIRFAQWVNRRIAADNPKALGHVIADRPTSKYMCPSRARFLMTYLHRNPVEAGVTSDASGSTWTSHRAYLGLAECEGGLDLALGFELAGFEPSTRGRRELHDFVSRTEVQVDSLPAMTPPPVESSLVDHVVTVEEVILAVTNTMDIPLNDLLRGSRRWHVVLARRVALAVWAEHGLTAQPMVRALGLSSSGASRLVSRPHDTSQVQRGVERVMAVLAEEQPPREVRESQIIGLAPPASSTGDEKVR